MNYDVKLVFQSIHPFRSVYLGSLGFIGEHPQFPDVFINENDGQSFIIRISNENYQNDQAKSIPGKLKIFSDIQA